MYNECDSLCFSSKNIYNRTLYLIRKEYEESKTYNIMRKAFPKVFSDGIEGVVVHPVIV